MARLEALESVIPGYDTDQIPVGRTTISSASDIIHDVQKDGGTYCGASRGRRIVTSQLGALRRKGCDTCASSAGAEAHLAPRVFEALSHAAELDESGSLGALRPEVRRELAQKLVAAADGVLPDLASEARKIATVTSEDTAGLAAHAVRRASAREAREARERPRTPR